MRRANAGQSGRHFQKMGEGAGCRRDAAIAHVDQVNLHFLPRALPRLLRAVAVVPPGAAWCRGRFSGGESLKSSRSQGLSRCGPSGRKAGGSARPRFGLAVRNRSPRPGFERTPRGREIPSSFPLRQNPAATAPCGERQRRLQLLIGSSGLAPSLMASSMSISPRPSASMSECVRCWML